MINGMNYTVHEIAAMAKEASALPAPWGERFMKLSQDWVRWMKSDLEGVQSGMELGALAADGMSGQRVRGFQLMARKMAAIALSTDGPRDAVSSGDIDRAGGDVACEHCRLKYIEHPEIFPTVHLVCSGRVYKL